MKKKKPISTRQVSKSLLPSTGLLKAGAQHGRTGIARGIGLQDHMAGSNRTYGRLFTGFFTATFECVLDVRWRKKSLQKKNRSVIGSRTVK